ncbi:Putative nuclease YhcG [Methanimicrococcus hongohii]|uniref:Nuclease YhcG n=1 Tax=Methanimicrococcus hongohii TaxID=3028295 RepID=A0AA96ZUA5_9EURY|nr:Putative nuclease YhcG [Methanimicrococcus sp. Hf6]
MLINDKSYFDVLERVKAEIQNAQYKAVLGVNREQILLYWSIGTVIIENSEWGNKFIDNLARDIKNEFPDTTGYSVRNLKYMRKFAELFPENEIVQEPLAQLTWYHLQLLMDKFSSNIPQYIWYANKAVENGWSRNVLLHQIDMKLYERQAIADKTTNFESVLPSPQSELAQETLKNPYVFDFIEARKEIIEREIEQELVANIAKTIMELGTGFAYVGNQYHLEISRQDYYIDLLFYNFKLSCFIVIEIKNTEFKPEYAGKLNFYLSAVDDILKREHDNPTIGILLCKSRDKLIAEYALRDINKPIGVSEYKLSDFVPEQFADTLPTAEDIESRIKAKYETESNEVK